MDNSAQIIQPPTTPTVTIELPPTVQQSSPTVVTTPSATQPTFIPSVQPPLQPVTQPTEIPITTPQSTQPLIPSVDQMEATLKQSGGLAGEIAVQPVPTVLQGPLAAIQPESLQEQANFTQTISSPETDPQPNTLPENVELANTEINRYLAKLRSFLHHPIQKLIAVGLVLQGLRGVGKSARFILIDFPMLEQQLITHNLTQSQVNEHAIGAVMIMTTTVLSLFFAMRLTILNTKAAKTFNTVISVLLVVGNQFIHNYLAQFDLADQIGAVSGESLSTLQASSETLLTRLLSFF